MTDDARSMMADEYIALGKASCREEAEHLVDRLIPYDSLIRLQALIEAENQMRIDLEDLAKTIEGRFTPFTFICECSEEPCQQAKNDAALRAQFDTVRLIAAYIREWVPNGS